MASEDFYCEYILNNRVEFSKVKETNNLLAYYHTKPRYKTHIVIIPKEHITALAEVKDFGIFKEIFEMIGQITTELNLVDYKIINNNGKYQDSKHLHFHLVSDN